MPHPRIAITMGDPAGIGPEIIAKALAAGMLQQDCVPVVIGCSAILKKICADLSIDLTVRPVASPSEAQGAPGTAEVICIENVAADRHAWGRVSVESGKAVVDYIKRAVALARERNVDAIVTAPINKEIMNAAGHAYAGHTELLASLTGSTDYGMLFVGGGMRVMLATIHRALKDVPALITRGRVLRTLRLANLAAKDLGIPHPRIGVAALNPHAGEGGLFGTEEWDEILPAVLQARTAGINASDPVPADTLFHKAKNGHYDIVVAMYHDQGLAPLKMIAFGRAVNVTVGLPIIRTSVDHGTAYDIAGSGCADPASLVEATRLAALMARNRLTQGVQKP